MIDDESEEEKVNGYCHFNENGSNITFSIDTFGFSLTLYQLPASRSLGHGAVVWDAAIVFTKFIEYNPSYFNILKDKTVLELGSGCGLSGLGMMIKGSKVTMTDLDCVINELTIKNSEKIFSQLTSCGDIGIKLFKPVVAAIDWTDPLSDTLDGQLFDYILLTDCIFSVELAPHLIETILRHVGPKSEIICCHEIRDEDANNQFIYQLKNVCSIKKISNTKLHPNYQSDQIQIFTAKLKKKKKKLPIT